MNVRDSRYILISTGHNGHNPRRQTPAASACFSKSKTVFRLILCTIFCTITWHNRPYPRRQTPAASACFPKNRCRCAKTGEKKYEFRDKNCSMHNYRA